MLDHGLFLGPFYIEYVDILWTLLALALVFPLGIFYGKRLAAQGLNMDTAFQKGARPWVFLFGFLALSGLLAAVYKLPTWFSPYTLAFLEPFSWTLAKSGAVFLAGAAIPLGQASGRRQDLLAMGVLALICTLGVQYTQGVFLRPLDLKEIKPRLASDGSILQSTNVTCTAAAFANALQLFGIPATEAETARVLGTRNSGTSIYQLLSRVEPYGLYAHYVSIRPRHVVRMNRPTLVSIQLGPITHSILAYTYSPDYIGVIDPISGKARYNYENYLKKLERPEGVVLTQAPVPQISAGAPRYQIEALQKILQQEGYLTNVNGEWDAATQAAVAQFQQAFELPATGQADTQTWLLLTGPYQGLLGQKQAALQ